MQEWAQRGRQVEVFGRRLFCIDEGPSDAAVLERLGARERAPTLVMLHGFPSSSFDFHLVLDRLAERHRVVVHDHLGFGRSDKPRDYGYSLIEQAEHALGLWRALGIGEAHLLAHDYGTSVATEILARLQRGLAGELALRSLVLCNGSMHIELAKLTLTQRLLAGPDALAQVVVRGMDERRFASSIQKLVGEPGSLAQAEIDAMWAGIVRADGLARIPAIARYLHERRRHWLRWIGALERCELPSLVLWGRRDPIAVDAIARRLAAEMPKAELRWLDALGHFPMLEDPRAWVEPLLTWLDERERPRP